MDLKILDNALNFIGIIDDFSSVVINRKYADIESIVITINANKTNTPYLVSGNYVFVDDKFNKVFRIYNTKKVLNTKGITLTITGYSVMQIFKQRITIPTVGSETESHTDYIENIIKAYITNNCITSSDSGMNIPILSVANNHNLGSNITDSTRYKNLYDEVIRLTAIDDLGFKSHLDTSLKKIVFDIYVGKDKTTSNTVGNNPVIFSPDFDNLLEATVEITETTVQNYAIVGGSGEGTARIIKSVSDNTTCLDRHVFFIDASDLTTDAELTTKGQSQLILPSYYITAVINPNANVKYEADYDIGDKVSVVVDGLQLDTRIVEITETYQNNTQSLDVVFGTKSIDLATVLNRNNSRLAKLETI